MVIKKSKPKTPGKEGPKGEKPTQKEFSLRAATYFLTYKGVLASGQKIGKKQLANFLLNQNPNDVSRRPQKYMVSEQTYASGEPHLHVILGYENRKHITTPNFFDYLGVHPNVQTMRNMKAALQYMHKEDPEPYTNVDLVRQLALLRAKDTNSLYLLLKEQMQKDPFNFEPYRYIADNNLDAAVCKANYTKSIKLLRNVREALCNKLLYDKPGFKFIDRALIERQLSPSELAAYDSWSGYQVIVDHLNQIPRYRFRRPAKTKNLLITGPPSIGKSALVWQTYLEPHLNPLNSHVSVYPMGMKDWFPDYKSEIYDVIYWNESKLTSYSYDTILQLLDGSPVMLPSKGGGHKKVDNPLVIMTSNMTLDQMIQQKFNYSKDYQKTAKGNLSVRLTNVVVPPKHDLFLIQKLLVSASDSP